MPTKNTIAAIAAFVTAQWVAAVIPGDARAMADDRRVEQVLSRSDAAARVHEHRKSSQT